ncbi:hypothetical protein J2W32_001922 [Variovorax boronicumulans]|uniref:DUF2474 domain-containing protein n=1 Tax=Variovorax boronicumulans TaxID=436515 RepID=A0AAW8CK43_9BURK|nr:DUF2474 family protein [Variovorax boronicumulans]MDP9891703.1 hypothetical protein [Variovorax boronicumulans]MDQ0052876.1 hypothetical protein [Variovorax boronicumulans]
MATDTTEGAARPSRTWRRRLGWLAGIWLASVAVMFVVAVVFRFLMAAVGLSR